MGGATGHFGTSGNPNCAKGSTASPTTFTPISAHDVSTGCMRSPLRLSPEQRWMKNFVSAGQTPSSRRSDTGLSKRGKSWK